MVFNQESTVKLPGAQEYDPVENKSDVVFQTIIPSINIKLTGERVNVETFTSRSNNLYHSRIEISNLFLETMKSNCNWIF